MTIQPKSMPLVHGVLWALAILGAASAGADAWFAIGGLTFLAAVALGTLTSRASCRQSSAGQLTGP